MSPRSPSTNLDMEHSPSQETIDKLTDISEMAPNSPRAMGASALLMRLTGSATSLAIYAQCMSLLFCYLPRIKLDTAEPILDLGITFIILATFLTAFIRQIYRYATFVYGWHPAHDTRAIFGIVVMAVAEAFHIAGLRMGWPKSPYLMVVSAFGISGLMLLVICKYVMTIRKHYRQTSEVSLPSDAGPPCPHTNLPCPESMHLVTKMQDSPFNVSVLDELFMQGQVFALLNFWLVAFYHRWPQNSGAAHSNFQAHILLSIASGLHCSSSLLIILARIDDCSPSSCKRRNNVFLGIQGVGHALSIAGLLMTRRKFESQLLDVVALVMTVSMMSLVVGTVAVTLWIRSRKSVCT